MEPLLNLTQSLRRIGVGSSNLPDPADLTDIHLHSWTVALVRLELSVVLHGDADETALLACLSDDFPVTMS